MQIRTKILASHATMAVVVTVIAIGIVVILRIGDANQRQLRSSYEQIRAINLIAAWANDYSEQVAEIFILGTDETEIDEAREELLAALSTKAQLVADEIAYLADEVDVAGERNELRRIETMRQTLEELDLVRRPIGPLLAEGRRTEAEAIYRRDIEHRLDTVLGALIDTATGIERQEVTDAIANSTVLSERLRALALVLVGTAALLLLGNALMVQRAISRPVAALADAAHAVGQGDLSHVVHLESRDEFGMLATRFNLMTTQIREQHDRLLRAKSDLEQQVAERTGELVARGAELENAVARLRELDASRAQFFADISHELRTPLTVLRGHAEVTLRASESTPERMRQTLAQVVRKADQMGRLVEDLLFLSRSEAGTIVVERKPVDLHEIFAEVLMDSQNLPRKAGITISPQQTSDPAMVEGDAGRLRQALLIPLDNAIRLAPAGTTVRVELSVVEGQALVTVSDGGPGFTAEEVQRAFVRFFRGGASRGRSGRGAGLGLSIARWIVDQHAGTISISSTPGHGATVQIELPLMRART
ncbi:HAMP domain-containing protein [Palleronia marisminoris]|uniref:histidine kinase n=1 Tax=Palleronia marisminoris TaxID=315423 RepID=A0A1Y5RR30_9RHOB|nr:ATP-binding protein [Palleronia marisminoris]SFG26908.1 HAMP domain-containing protein [Palleronia marisminoris]SLN20514.1 putative sensor histidine kinase TcrY [Palleronia marisminoris]